MSPFFPPPPGLLPELEPGLLLGLPLPWRRAPRSAPLPAAHPTAPFAAPYRSLRVLDLYRGNLRGPLPEDWGRAGAFPALVSLNLEANKLQGGC